MSDTNPWLAARNLLAVRLDNAGDVVMLGPALRAIKASSPECRITLLASPSGAKAASLLPWIDSVLVWRSIWQDLGHLPFNPARENELIRLIADHSFDGAVIFSSFSQTPHVAAYACYLAGIPLRAGESKEFGGGTLSTELRGTPDETHQVDRNLRLVQALGFTDVDPALEIAIPDVSREEVARRLWDEGIPPEQPLMLLHPGASAEARRYPALRFGQVAELLQRQGWRLVVTGSEREREMLEIVADGNDATPVFTDLSIQEFAALVARASAIVCGNTLPLHLAEATRTPLVALYSGTELISQWGPRFTPARVLQRATDCTPCYRFTCPIGLPCLDFAPEEVVAAITALVPLVAVTAGEPRMVMA
jgi:ADP-heptose:LPS heptosyltransferase